jgi:peptide/nickel transport system substrate-binding protein
MRALILVMVAATVVACAPPSSAPAARPGEAPASQAGSGRTEPQPARTLVSAIRVEPTTLAARALRQTGITLGATIRIFNAGLGIVGDREQLQPYLAEAMPQLNSDTWRVNADGTMETIYRLKPNLTWHDGQRLTAEDFVFTRRVYADPQFGLTGATPYGQIDDVTAPDARTIVVRWKRPFPFAGELEASGMRSSFAPLPRHLLETQYDQLSTEAFLALPFWTTAYVGAGPFKVERWEPGSFIEASAFDGHALGRPKIDRIQLRFINDANTALSNILAGGVQLIVDDAIYFQQASVLKREWASNQAGSIVITPGLFRYTQLQLAPEYNGTPSLLDLRVRKALAFGLDREAINDGIYEGQGIIAHSMIPPTTDYFPLVDGAVVKYPFDPRRSEQLMAEASFAKGADGTFTSLSTGRFSVELKVIQGAQNEAERDIMAARWRQVGFDIREAVLPAAQSQDGQARATFPDLMTTATPAGDSTVANQGTANIPRPENRWNGGNRGAWSNAEYDRLAAAYNMTLDRNERIQQIARMMALFTDEVPSIAISFNPGITAFTSSLRGPQTVGPNSTTTWNIHQWELR